MLPMDSKRIGRGALVLLLLAAALVTIFYGRLVQRNLRAAEAFSKNEYELAQQGYADLLSTFADRPWLKRLFRGQYQLAVLNRAQLLYAQGDYRDAVELLENEANNFPYLAGAPQYHFWMGNAFFRIAVLQEGADLSFESLQTVADEYKEVLRLDPNHWDAKHNYEFVQELAARKSSGDPQDKETLQLLLGDIRLTSEQRQGELPEQLH